MLLCLPRFFLRACNMLFVKELSAVAALLVAAVLAFLSFGTADTLTANMLILIAQFLVYSLTLFGFGELANRLMKTFKNETK